MFLRSETAATWASPFSIILIIQRLPSSEYSSSSP